MALHNSKSPISTGLVFYWALYFFGLLGNASVWADSAPAVPFLSVDGDEGIKVDVFHVKAELGFQTSLGYPDIYKARKYALEHTPDYSFTNTYINREEGQVASVAFRSDATAATCDFFGPAAADDALTDQTPLNSATTIIRLFGFFNVRESGTYRFGMDAADGAGAFFLGGNGQPGTGNLILARNSDGSISKAPGLPNPLGLDFFEPDGVRQTGYFPIELLYIKKVGTSSPGVFSFSIRGSEAVRFKNGTVDPSTVASFVPLHRYTFNEDVGPDNIVHDDGVADREDGKLVGDATVANGSLITKGTPSGADSLNSNAITRFFHGSFTIEDWFTLDDSPLDKQTLFSFAGDTSHYVLARIIKGNGNTVINVEFNNGTNTPTSVRVPVPLTGEKTLLSLSYDGSTDEINLYLNGVKADGAHMAGGIKMGDFVCQEYIGINGLSPFGDPGLVGSCDEFRMYRVALSADQIAQNFKIGPDHQLPGR